MLVLGCGGCATGITGSPRAVTATTAVVDGRVVSTVGGAVEYWAEYGPTRAYGSKTAHSTATVEQNVPFPVIAEIGGLTRSTTYHFRVCASDSQQTGGPACGSDQRLETQSFDCGETVTSSVRLTQDLSCPADVGYALGIGADGIDVNLAGHLLAGAIGSGGGAESIHNDGHADVTIRNGRVGGAIQLSGASRNRIRDVDSTSTGNGLVVDGGQGNEIRASSFDARAGGIGGTGTDDLVIAGTKVTSTFGPGIQVEGDGARVVRNVVTRGDLGGTSAIVLTGSGGRIVDNDVTGAWLSGVIVLFAGAGNLIAENDVSGSGRLDPSLDRGGDGIFVDDPATGTFLRDNVTRANAGDGMEVQGSGARLRGNAADGNGDFGIDAAAGTVDLGGNSASGNGNPLQCRNVFCS